MGRVIDFHTHIFPDKIAAGAVSALERSSGNHPYADGTRAGLRAAMAAGGADIAVNLPVLTSPAQFESVLSFAARINEDFAATGRGILSFAGMHPDLPDIAGAMRRVREAGFRGIKIHPEYQDAFIDDEASYRLLAAAKENGLITVTHAGVDAAYRERTVRCSPERVARVLDRLGGYPELVLAHLGGAEMLGEVMAHLAGRAVCFATAFVLPDTTAEDFLALLRAHGSERILFATDSPWQDIAACAARIRSFGLSELDVQGILYNNAKKLLHIQ